MSGLTKALWSYNVAIRVNEKSVKNGECDHLEWVAEEREEAGKMLVKFVNSQFATCSVGFLAAYYHWLGTFEMYKNALDRLRGERNRKDWLALERAVAVILFHQGFVRYKHIGGERYFQLALKKEKKQEWMYLRAQRC